MACCLEEPRKSIVRHFLKPWRERAPKKCHRGRKLCWTVPLSRRRCPLRKNSELDVICRNTNDVIAHDSYSWHLSGVTKLTWYWLLKIQLPVREPTTLVEIIIWNHIWILEVVRYFCRHDLNVIKRFWGVADFKSPIVFDSQIEKSTGRIWVKMSWGWNPWTLENNDRNYRMPQRKGNADLLWP